MIGSDSHKASILLLNVQKCDKKRHETLYTPYKIILFIVSSSKLTGIVHFLI